MDRHAGPERPLDHPFLLLYTVTRLAVLHAAAAARGGANQVEVARWTGDAPFLADLAVAVFFDDGAGARSLWTQSPLASETRVTPLNVQRIVFQLLHRAAEAGPLPSATSAADFLPDPYEP